MTRSSSSTACWSRPRSSSSPASRAAPWRPIPTANRAWMAPSCRSLAIRSRSSSTARRCSSAWRRTPRATAACSAKVSTSWTSASRRGAPARRWPPSASRGSAAHGQGDEQRRADPGTDDRLGGALVGRRVGQDHRLAGADHLAGHRPLDRERRAQQLLGEQPVGRLDRSRPGRPGGPGWPGRPGQLPGVAAPPGRAARRCRPARMAVVMARTASSRWARSLTSSYRWAFSIATPAWAASRTRARSSSASKSSPPASRSGRGCRRPGRGPSPGRRGTSASAGGWPGTDRAGVVGDVVQPQRPGVVDQDPEDAAAHRDVVDGRPLGGSPRW